MEQLEPKVHEAAGKLPPPEILIDPAQIERAYYEAKPEEVTPVHFGTSGHRGSPLRGSFCEPHVLAIVQAICDYRKEQGIDGPLFLGRDTHAVSEPAFRTALEVLAANGVWTVIESDDLPTPTPSISRAILHHNFHTGKGTADGIVITPSHNPPEDGGIKYNPPHGGPAEDEVTRWIEHRANELLENKNRGIRRMPIDQARDSETVVAEPLRLRYAEALTRVLDMERIRSSGLKIGVDPLGGASLRYWEVIAEKYGLNLEILHPELDSRFPFVHVDHDGKIRMDCSSPYAMAGLVERKDQYDVAWGCDPDADRHGIVCPTSGLMNPNYYLATAIDYLLATRTAWAKSAKIGKTLVSSALIDRVVNGHKLDLFEVPVGFKWFAIGLFEGWLLFGGEESAGASFLQKDGRVWTTDKDGMLLGLLAAEMTVYSKKTPAQRFEELIGIYGRSWYRRVDMPIDPGLKQRLLRLDSHRISLARLAGEPILHLLTHAPGNGEPIGGIKVVSNSGWFAVRPSGTEEIVKLYAESFVGEEHLNQIVQEAIGFLQTLV